MYQKCQQLRKLARITAEKEREYRVSNKMLNRVRAEVAEYIAAVPDPYMRQILTMRYLDMKRWNDIALELGGANNEDSLRMMCVRYLSRH